MTRFLKRALFCLVPATVAALVLGVPPAAPDLGLQSVGLSCSDGTALNLSLSITELIGLADAVSAINLDPAGDPPLACSLSGDPPPSNANGPRSEEHTSELQSQSNLVCRLLLEKKKKDTTTSSPRP